MTPIQAKAIPIVLAGRDVMGAAQTGTGKTAAFSIPLLQKMLRHENASMSPARHPVRALVLAPTRELADQVAANILGYARHTKLRTAVVFGGIDMKPQTLQLKGGVEILWPRRGGCSTTSRPRTACSIRSNTWCWTRPTACLTSASCPTCSASCPTCPSSGRPCCSLPPSHLKSGVCLRVICRPDHGGGGAAQCHGHQCRAALLQRGRR